MAYLNLAAIRLCTEAEGPGRRIAIWVQGCQKRCPGCCNQEMQELKRNIIVDTAELIKLLNQSIEHEPIEGITFIGGEPMLQAAGLSEVAKWARAKGLNVLVFTGYLLEELQAMHNTSIDALLASTDLLVDGPFMEKYYDTERDWVGSSNQRVHYFTEAYRPGVEYSKQNRQMELLVSADGILVNGWPHSELISEIRKDSPIEMSN